MTLTQREELAEAFEAVAEDGTYWRLQAYQTFTEFRPLAKLAIRSNGGKRFQTVAGAQLRGNPDGTFTDLITGKTLRRK